MADNPDDVLAWGTLSCADFDEHTLEFKIVGDMPTVARGRYAIVSSDKFRTTVMMADLWRKQQRVKV
jgi:hypothetical protein